MTTDEQLGVIFDMDGVLVDSYHQHFESWRIMLAEHGLTMTERQFAETFGQTNKQIIPQLWPGEASDELIERLADRKEQVYRELIAKDVPAVPGLHKLLADLDAAGAKIAVGSSGPPENVEAVLKALDIGRHFHAIVTGRDVTQGKPHPQVFLIGAEKLRLPPQRCVVIEDAPAGIQAAHRAGMKAVALTTSHPAEKLADAELVLSDLTTLSVEKLAKLANS